MNLATLATVNLASELGKIVPLPPAWDWLLFPVAMLVGCGIITGWITIVGLLAIWLERKVAGHIQCRLGPMEVGPHGLLQTVADGVKLLAKEDVIPEAADRPLFIMAPWVVFAGVFAMFVCVPFSDRFVIADLNLGVFYLAAIGSVEAIGVIMAGWASNNKWSLFGAMRTATQVVSYEIPLGLSLLTVVMLAGSFSLREITHAQGVGEHGDHGWFFCWYVFRNPFMPILFIIFFTAALAETKRSPFDLPEAESELVSGFHTEYSGMRFSIFFLAEYAAMYLVCAMAAVLFFGGWYTGIPVLDRIGGFPGVVIGAGAMVTKAWALIFVMIWLRWTLPRIRLDQVMYICLKVLLPFGVLSLLGTAVWEYLMGGEVVYFKLYRLVTGS